MELLVEILGSTVIQLILEKIFDISVKKASGGVEFYNNRKRKKYEKIISSDNYKNFVEVFLQNYYGEDFFTNIEIMGKKYKFPVTPFFMDEDVKTSIIEESKNCLKRDKKEDYSIRYYDALMNNTNDIWEFDETNHKAYKKLDYYRAYHGIVGININSPDRPGFMLDSLDLKDKKMTKVNVHIGTFAENVYSTHVLEYELYKAYKKYKYIDSSNWEEVKNFCKIRNRMHEDAVDGDKESLLCSIASGHGRDSLLGVQMLVLMKTELGYMIKIIQRSKKVAIKPGVFQLVPSGGFEILNDSEQGYSEYELIDNMSPGCAVFREFLEEIFGEEEFEGKGAGSVNEALLKDEKINALDKMIKEGNASFDFLGSVVDLSGLRHELSFVLVIKDEQFEKTHKFRGNDEATSKSFISGVYLDTFENKEDIWENLHGPSAVMWKMFKESDIYKTL